jgi:hypothetical protein
MKLSQKLNMNQKTTIVTLFYVSIISFFLALIFNQTSQAQRPEQQHPNLLSRTCHSERLEKIESPTSISIGRELYDAIFTLDSYLSYKPFITCELLNQSDSDAISPSHLRLEFGLADSADLNARVTVSAYRDGELWGTVTIAPKETATVWDINIKDIKSVSIEAECMDSCTTSQLVYFSKADLEFLGGSIPTSSSPSFSQNDYSSSPREDETSQRENHAEPNNDPIEDTQETLQKGKDIIDTINNTIRDSINY